MVPTLLLAAALSISQAQATEPAKPAQPSGGADAAAPGPTCEPALATLSFLTGSWCLAQPKGAMIQEQWTEPRGNSIVAVFRRVLGNGYTPFYEFSQIVAEKDRVVLRQIHVHADFDTDPRRAKPMVLRMSESSDSHAVFEPVAAPEESHAGDLQRITYRRVDADTLLLRVESKPPRPDGEKGAAAAPAPDAAPAQVLEFRMTRCAG